MNYYGSGGALANAFGVSDRRFEGRIKEAVGGQRLSAVRDRRYSYLLQLLATVTCYSYLLQLFATVTCYGFKNRCHDSGSTAVSTSLAIRPSNSGLKDVLVP